jgi:hypothetical protein
MQDILAIAIALAAAFWLGRTLWRRLARPGCGPPPAGPPGSDGFVPLDSLSLPEQKESGRPTGRPDR